MICMHQEDTSERLEHIALIHFIVSLYIKKIGFLGEREQALLLV